MVGRGDDDGVRNLRGSWVGGGIFPAAGDCVRAGRLFLNFGVGIGGSAEVGGFSDGRVGCGMVEVMMPEEPR